MNASDQLAAYRNTGSERAFTAVVRHYTNLVYSAAKRRIADSTLAEDVVQMVFARLAKTPPQLHGDAELVAWLHRTTTHVAIDFWRSETRRRSRETQLAAMQPTVTQSTQDSRVWEELSPHLDQALDQLSDADRQAVLLRFFEQLPMRDIGRIIGVSEDATKMRVGRAVDRLRHQLAARGVTCTVIVLASVLTQRAVEAAPAHLLTSLATVKFTLPTVASAGGLAGVLTELIRSKIAMASAGIAGLVISILLVAHHSEPAAQSLSETSPELIQARSAVAKSRQPYLQVTSMSPAAPDQTEVKARFILRVTDQETGAGIPGAKIHAPYFYAGGVGENHDLETDSDGNALIPEPDHPDQRAGLNVFVSAESYVPKAVNLHGIDTITNQNIELERALAVGGLVVNEQGELMPNVELQAKRDRSDAYKNGGPTTDFQTSKVKTDSYGRWLFPYVPKTYDAIVFWLTCSNYAVTLVSVPVGQLESLNATLVVERGYAVAGQVLDSTGRSIPGATVREHHNFGYRRLSTRTDENGFFLMQGLQVPGRKVVNFSDPMNPKPEWTEQEQKIQLIAEAKGMTLEEQTVLLTKPTNIVNFTLTPGSVLRGRVVDEFGNPIPAAAVRTDYDFKNQIDDRYKWLSHTDDSGLFEWDSAPPQPVCFWFEADGYEVIRGLPIVADGTDHEIVLKRNMGTSNR